MLKNVLVKIPPFKGLYQQINELKKQNERLQSQYSKLLEKYEYIYSVEQRFEKNMSSHYENLKEEVRSYRNDLNEKNEKIYSRISEEHESSCRMIAEKENQFNKDLQYYYYKALPTERYAEGLREWYYKRTFEKLDLDNPQTFNEKIQWLKIYDNSPIKTKLADKVAVREWIKQIIGEEYLIPMLGVYDKFEDIDFESLPNQFAMKTNHGSATNIVVTDKSKLNIKEAKKKFDKWLGTNYAFCYGYELQYKDIPPRIIIEKYMENNGNELFDYRFFCFNGKVQSIWVDVDSGLPTHRRNIYDLDWNLMPVMVTWPNDEELDRKPKNLSEMIRIAEKLSKDFIHVRVDLYEIDSKIYFGEMTFTSGSGLFSWNPPEYNKIFGDYIKLPTV